MNTIITCSLNESKEETCVVTVSTFAQLKSKCNRQRFSLEEQIEYIKAAVKIQEIIAKKMEIDLEEKVIDSIFKRLKIVY